jgi:hypothetical protein
LNIASHCLRSISAQPITRGLKGLGSNLLDYPRLLKRV